MTIVVPVGHGLMQTPHSVYAMIDIDKVQIKESTIIIEGETHSEWLARVWAAGLAADIDNEFLRMVQRDLHLLKKEKI